MMKSQLLSTLMLIAFSVSTIWAQDAKTDDKKDMAKAAKALHGTWVGDADKTEEAIDAQEDLEITDDMRAMVLERIKSITVEFEDGVFNVSIDDDGMSGKWSVKKVKKDGEKMAVFIHTVTDEDFGGREKDFEIHFVGDKHMKMIDLDDGGPPIMMQRKSKDKDKKKKDKSEGKAKEPKQKGDI